MKIRSNYSALLMSIALLAPIYSQAAQPDSPRLGSLLGEFSYAMGVPDPVCQLGSMCFKKGGLTLLDMKGTVTDIVLYWDEKTAPSSVRESRARIQQFIPLDAVLQKTYSTQQGSIVDVYVSKSLAKRVPAKQAMERVDGSIAGYRDFWGGEKPGTFIALHMPRRKTALYLGNNP